MRGREELQFTVTKCNGRIPGCPGREKIDVPPEAGIPGILVAAVPLTKNISENLLKILVLTK
jgi:hypothetical protein